MKTLEGILLFIFACIVSTTTIAQETGNPYDVNFKINYNQEAHYPGGEQAFYTYIFSNIQYSDEAKQNKMSGSVLISFDVLTDSTLTNFVILSSPGFGVDQEIIRLLKPLKFAPALAAGQVIKQNMMLSIPVRAGVGSTNH